MPPAAGLWNQQVPRPVHVNDAGTCATLCMRIASPQPRFAKETVPGHSMAEPTVTCPNCSTSIPLTESLAAPLIKATQLKYERAMADKDRDIAGREAGLRAQQAALEQAKAAVDEQV